MSSKQLYKFSGFLRKEKQNTDIWVIASSESAARQRGSEFAEINELLATRSLNANWDHYKEF